MKNVDIINLFDRWAYFVNECSEGYEWDYSEYLNELGVRDIIEKFMIENRNNIEFSHYVRMFSEVDCRFKALLQSGVELPEGQGWWQKGVLKKAGEEYRIYMLTGYGITVEPVDS